MGPRMRQLVVGAVDRHHPVRFALAHGDNVLAIRRLIAGKSREARCLECHSADLDRPIRVSLLQRRLAFLHIGGRKDFYGVGSRAWSFETVFSRTLPSCASFSAPSAAPTAAPLGITLIIASGFLAPIVAVLANEFAIFLCHLLAYHDTGRSRGSLFLVTAPTTPAAALPLNALLLQFEGLRSLLQFLFFLVRDGNLGKRPRSQGRRGLNWSKGAQPLQPESRRDQRIVPCYEDPNCVTRFQLYQRVAFLV